MVKKEKSSSGAVEFRVVLDGLSLPSDCEDRIENGIRKVVMEELASLDFQGDLILSPLGGPGGGGMPEGINVRSGKH